MSTGNGQLNFNDTLAEKVLKELGNICYEFKNLATEYPKIIENITDSGWTGQSNSNFISKSGEYIENLNVVYQDINNFKEEFGKRLAEARKQLEW